MNKKYKANKVFDEKGKRRTSVRVEKWLYDEVEKYRGLHRLKSWSVALHLSYRQNLQKIEELTSQQTPSVENLVSKKDVEKLDLECPYGTLRSQDQIDCAKDFEKKGRIHKVTRAFCSKCWEREQKKKFQDRARGVEIQKAQIHRLQESVNQTISKERNDVVICLKTDQVIPSIQCNNCDAKQRKRCQTVMEDSVYKTEIEKVRRRIG